MKVTVANLFETNMETEVNYTCPHCSADVFDMVNNPSNDNVLKVVCPFCNRELLILEDESVMIDNPKIK